MVLVCQRHVTRAQAVPNAHDGKNAIGKGSRRANGDQAVHIGAEMEQGFEAHLIILAVHIGNGQGQKELHHSERHAIFNAGKKAGQRQARHAAHGNVHQRHQKNK